MYSIFQTRPQSLALHAQGINGATAMQLPKALGKPAAVLPRPMQPQGRSANSFCCALDCSILPRPISSNSIKSSMVLAGSAKTLGKVWCSQNNILGYDLHCPKNAEILLFIMGVLPHEWQAKQEEVESQVTAVVAAPATAPPVFSTARACQTFAALDV